VHEYTYLRYIDEKCKASVITAAAGGRPAMALPAFYAPPGMLDSDTPLQPQSLEAAKRFCGYVLRMYCTCCTSFVS
jgi:acetoin utilization deacetylase AcuC-like enzyme